jgi:predicted heme/steroid binding protein/uncharacterized membrane protein
MKKFTKDDLISHNGEHGSKSYIAYKDKVYDVSGSRKWKDGVHVQIHHAGMDLTEAIDNAPHGPELLADFPVVGKLVVRQHSLSHLKRCFTYLSDWHVHSVFSHFSVSSFVLSPIFLLVYLFNLELKLFEDLSFYMLVIGVVSLPFSIVTGLLDWWIKYSLDMTKYLKEKLTFGVLLIVMAVICFFWRISEVNLVLQREPYYLVYVGINLSLLFYAVMLGWIGGKLVFPFAPVKKWGPQKASEGMIEVLNAAIPRERETYRFYKKLKKLATDPSQKMTFDFLAHEEKIHEAKLQQIVDELKEEDSEK